MLASDTGYMNTRDAMIMPNDPFSMSLKLVDAYGVPISLHQTDIRWRVVPLGTGMRMSTTLTGSVPIGTPNANPLSIVIVDSISGIVTLNCIGDVLNDPRGYDYVVELKPIGDDVSLFRAVARGNIQVFNRPRGL